jgi:hypothetical protein
MAAPSVSSSVPLSRQSLWNRAAFVFKRGVLGWGFTCALAEFLYRSYKSGAWLSPSEVGLLLMVWSAVGVLFGMSQIRFADKPDKNDAAARCPECGEAQPAHAKWCSSTAGN